jgi:hypothetical protein
MKARLTNRINIRAMGQVCQNMVSLISYVRFFYDPSISSIQKTHPRVVIIYSVGNHTRIKVRRVREMNGITEEIQAQQLPKEPGITMLLM